MQRLAKSYLGTWTYTENYPKSAMLSEGGVNTGVYTSELGPGGNSILNRFHSNGPVGDFTGVIVMTWDAKEKAYKAFVFGGDFPGAIVQSGQFEGDSLVYRSELTMGTKKIALRNVTNFSDGKIISEQYSSANGGPEGLLVRVEALKQ